MPERNAEEKVIATVHARSDGGLNMRELPRMSMDLHNTHCMNVDTTTSIVHSYNERVNGTVAISFGERGCDNKSWSDKEMMAKTMPL